MKNRYYIELDIDHFTMEKYLYVYNYGKDKASFHHGKRAITRKLHQISKSNKLVENGFPGAMWNKSKSFDMKLYDIGIKRVLISTS